LKDELLVRVLVYAPVQPHPVREVVVHVVLEVPVLEGGREVMDARCQAEEERVLLAVDGALKEVPPSSP